MRRCRPFVLAWFVCLVTGSTAGLGFFSSLQLAGAGGHVIMTGRNPNRLASARAAVLRNAPDASVETLLLDTSNLGSVRAAAATVKSTATWTPASAIARGSAAMVRLPLVHVVCQSMRSNRSSTASPRQVSQVNQSPGSVLPAPPCGHGPFGSSGTWDAGLRRSRA